MIRVLLVFALALLAVAPKGKPLGTPSPASSPGAKQWNMKTDQLNANMATGRFSAPHHVLLVRSDGSTVDADRADGNYKLHQASLFGHVTVHDTGGTFGLQSAQGQQNRGPATLTSDELHMDDLARTYDASGNVHYEQGDATVDAQTAHLNDETHTLDLSGKVHVVQGERTLEANHAVYNTLTGQGQAEKDVTITMPGPSPSIATPKPINIGHKGP